MIIDVIWLLIMAVCGVFLIELRDNYRLHKLMDAHIDGLRLQPYRKHKAPFGKRHV